MNEKARHINKFDITGKVCIVTGGGGLIGLKHTEAIIEGGGIPVLLDIAPNGLAHVREIIQKQYGGEQNVVVETYVLDITDKAKLKHICNDVMVKYGHIDVLINNAANNPKVEGGSKNLGKKRFTDFPVDIWDQDIAVGLTGAMLCCQVFGEIMERQGKGVVLNISSDYGLIAPDQRIYYKEGISEEE